MRGRKLVAKPVRSELMLLVECKDLWYVIRYAGRYTDTWLSAVDGIDGLWWK